MPAAQKQILRDLIDKQLLLEKGKELGITGETETVKRLNQMRQQMVSHPWKIWRMKPRSRGVSFEDFKEQIREDAVTAQVIGQEVGAKLHITDEEVQQFYNQHKKESEGPEEVNLSEIRYQPRRQIDSKRPWIDHGDLAELFLCRRSRWQRVAGDE